MAESSYRPERRVDAPVQPMPGTNYGVTPIPPAEEEDGDITPPNISGGGGGGIGGSGLGGLALSALTNPTVIRQASNLLSGLGGNSTMMHETAHMMPDIYPGFGGFDTTMHEFAHPMLDGLVEGGAGFVGDGGGLSADLLGSGVSNGGSWLSGLQGTAMTPVGGGIEGFFGAGLAGGGFDLLSGLGTIGGGLLGNYVASQAPYEGGRDPMGKTIGAGLGSAVGGIFLGPIGAFLGAQFGGMIGGQFGPDMSTGPIVENIYSYGNGHDGWRYAADADNGATANPELAGAFQQALQDYIGGRGYSMTPGAQYGFQMGNTVGGEGTDAFGEGYYMRPMSMYAAGEGPASQMYFGQDLSAPWQPLGLGRGEFAPANRLPAPVGFLPEDTMDRSMFDVAPGATVADAMMQYAFNDMYMNGVISGPDGQMYQRPYAPTNGTPTDPSVG